MEFHSHGCSVFDVILLSQLLAGEVHVLLPQPLALPTGFLRRITNIKGRNKRPSTPLKALKMVKIPPSSCRLSGEGEAGRMVQGSAGLSSTGDQRPQIMGIKDPSKAQENKYKMNP